MTFTVITEMRSKLLGAAKSVESCTLLAEHGHTFRCAPSLGEMGAATHARGKVAVAL